MFKFKDGTLKKGAYVVIDGVEYEVHMPEYEGETPLSAENLNLALQGLYPVGSIYMSVNSTNPAELFGFGTWEAWGKGKVPVGVDTSDNDFKNVEKIGGEKTHVLTRAELPAERLKVLDGKYLPDREVQAGGAAGAGNDWPGLQINVNGDSTNAKMVTENMGSGQAHNNLQPYITCYMWKRTA